MISLARGDHVGAGLSFASMIPVYGDAIGKGGKVARYAAKYGDEAAEAGKQLAKNAPRSAFEVARQGGKHAGFLKNYAGKPASQIQKGINSLKKQIAEHQDKIANPGKYIPGFDKLDPRQQQALLKNKWPSDIVRLQEQLEILEGLLRSMGGGS
ncbi:MAG: hypothetical protein KatS3mg111_1704 [Pirellulaceae bacterium]|nr:MAG: hypothetical protein KatS3mg111_1704 [Pirellulaceae bacterium]